MQSQQGLAVKFEVESSKWPARAGGLAQKSDVCPPLHLPPTKINGRDGSTRFCVSQQEAPTNGRLIHSFIHLSLYINTTKGKYKDSM
jgi:hypothetical protein